MPTRPPIHDPGYRRAAESARGTAAARGYDGRWQRYRAVYLRKFPLCCVCQAEGRDVPATVVDHRIPHRGDRKLFWDPENHQPLCKPHHDQKTGGGQ